MPGLDHHISKETIKKHFTYVAKGYFNTYVV